MDNELQGFLETAFASVKATSKSVGRVLVDANYGASIDHADAAALTAQLMQCLRQETLGAEAMGSPQGFDIQVTREYPLLAKYVRKITLYRETGMGTWVQVLPPGETLVTNR